MGTDVDDMNGGGPAGLPQPQADARQYPEKRAVHALTLSEIHDKILAPLIDFFQGELAQRRTHVQETERARKAMTLLVGP